MCSKMFNRQNQTGKGQRAKTGISESGSQAQVQSSKVGQSGSNTEITNSRMNNAQKCQPGQEQDFAVFAWKCAA